MKKLKRIIMTLLFVLLITACTNNDNGNEDQRTQGREGEALIWRVSSDTATVYLVGTIHVGLENLYPMQQILLDAFYRSEVLAVEVDIVAIESSLQTQFELAQLMILDDGTTISDHLSEETMDLLEEYLDTINMSGMERQILHSLRIGALTVTLMQNQLAEWGFMEVSGVDKFFLELAHEREKEIIEVETATFQIEMFMNFSPRLQEFMLRDLIETPVAEARAHIDRIYNYWLAGNDVGLRNLLDETNQEMMAYSRTLFEEYNTAIMLNRDIAMVEKIHELLDGNQTVFFAVGAAHIIGENGVIEQLEAEGLTVTRVSQ